MRTYERIFIHTTSANYNRIPRQFFAVNRWHKERWGYYFNKEEGEQVAPSSLGYHGGYTILIEPNGDEFRYREDWEETMAVKGWNRRSLSVALAFDGDIQMPTEAQIKTLITRLNKWREKYNIPIENINPHRWSKNTSKTCFGSLLPDDWGQKLLNPAQKDEEDQTKKDNTEAEKQVLRDTVRTLMLQLRILLVKYLKLLKVAAKKIQ